MDSVISIKGLGKTYASGLEALKPIDLDIRRGEIFALLGPNGAGKTTMISIVCGIVTPSVGTVTVDGHDHQSGYRVARRKIGLVPQELHTDSFESVWATVTFSRGLFGCAPNPAHIEKVLKELSLWDKRKAKIMELSVGSSRNRISGSWESALAIITRRFMPPDSSMIFALRLSQSDSSFSTFSIWAGFGGQPNRPRLKATVAHTLSKESVCNSCGTSPILRRATR